MSKGQGGPAGSWKPWISDGSASGRVDLDDPGHIDATAGETNCCTETVKTSVTPMVDPSSDASRVAAIQRHQVRTAAIQQLMAQKRRQRRRSLKETGDYLGVQGVNPLTGQPDVITPSSSDERNEMAEDVRHGNYPVPRTFKENMPSDEDNLVGEVGGDSDQNLSSKLQSNTGNMRNLSQQQRREPSQWSSVQEPNLSPIIQSSNSDSDKASTAVKASMTEDDPLIYFTPPRRAASTRDWPLPRTPAVPNSPTRVSSCETVIRAPRPQTASPPDFWAQELYEHGIELSHALTPSHVRAKEDQKRHGSQPRDEESHLARHITFADQSSSMNTASEIEATPPGRAAQSIFPDAETSVFRGSKPAPEPGGTAATQGFMVNAEETMVTPQLVPQNPLGNDKQEVSPVQPPVASTPSLNKGMPCPAFSPNLGFGITPESATPSGENVHLGTQRQTRPSAMIDGLDAAILLPRTPPGRVARESTSIWAGCPAEGLNAESAQKSWTPPGTPPREEMYRESWTPTRTSPQEDMYRVQEKETNATVVELGDFQTYHSTTGQQETEDEQCVYTPTTTTTGSAPDGPTGEERNRPDSLGEDNSSQRRAKWFYNRLDQTPPERDYQARGPWSASQNWRGPRTGTPQTDIRSAPGTVNRAVDEKGRPEWWAPDKASSRPSTSTWTHFQRDTRKESGLPDSESNKPTMVPQPEDMDSSEEDANKHPQDADVADAYYPDELDGRESDEDITFLKMLVCFLWHMVVGILRWYVRQVRPCWDPRSGFWGRAHRGEASWGDLYAMALFMVGVSYLLRALAKGWELAEMLRELISAGEEYY